MAILPWLEPGASTFLGQLATGVPPLVAEKAIVIVVRPRAGRDDERGRTPRLQHARDLAEGPPVVRHVLEQVRAHDRVEALVLERQLAHIGLQEPGLGDRRMGFAQPGRDQVDADQPCLRMRGVQILEQEASRTAEIGDSRAPGESGPMPSMIARRVQRSRKWVRDASAWTASSSSDQLTAAASPV